MKKIKFILISILILIASLSLFACTGGATNSYDYDDEETSWECGKTFG